MSRSSTRARIETIVARTTEPIFALNAERQVMYFNAACEQLTGQPAEQVFGLECNYAGPTGATGLPSLATSLAPPPEVFEGRSVVTQSVFAQPDGERAIRHIQFVPCRDDEARVAWVIGIVTERPADTNEPTPAHFELHAELLRLRERVYSQYGTNRIVGASLAMRRVLAQIRAAAETDASVFIRGEAGTGKQLVAGTIHAAGSRRAAAFVAIDCVLLPPELLERDLFGARAGDETSSGRPRAGLMHRANAGTIFLRNVTQLPRDVQVRLIDAMRETSSINARDTSRAGPRLIVADRRDPADAVAAGELRPDLFFALSTLGIDVQPLRERREDVPLLSQLFVEAANARGGKQVAGVAAAALEILSTFDWPGNVRELNEVIQQAHAASGSHMIGTDDLPARIRGEQGGTFAAPPLDPTVDLDAVMRDTERKLIEQAIRRSRGNKTRAAELLSISRPRLLRLMEQLGMTDGESPNSESSDA